MIDFGEYLPFWGKLSNIQKKKLSAAIQEKTFSKGTVIHRGEKDCIGLLLPLEGHLRVYVISDEGKELTLYRVLPRDMCLLSASCIMNSLQFDVIVSAEQDTRVLHIPADVYKSLMEESAPVANYTNELMATRFSDVMWLMDQILNRKLDARLAAFLVEESQLEGTQILRLTHEQIAGHIGSAREVVSRMLKYFQREGLVESGRGSLRILDERRLEGLAGDSLR